MSGIYVHIPFCKKACHYCNFHFSTSTHLMNGFLQSLYSEIELQKNYLNEPVTTIYFGGGTPSILSEKDLEQIMAKLKKVFTVNENAEITIEANPDDISSAKLTQWKNTGINRLSIGIQSFYDDDLSWMNRAHNAQQAEDCIYMAQDKGINNISIDLIYGTPTLTNERWYNNVEKAISTGIQHLSCYALTVEPDTALYKMIERKKVTPLENEKQAHHFELLMTWMNDADFEHYEISNFAKMGFRSKHNSNYWQGVPYVGLGPSAHSFNGISRQWNVANNSLYIKSLEQNIIPYEIEILTKTQQFNEYIMTSLRTIEGVSLDKINEQFGILETKHLIDKAEAFFKTEQLYLANNHLTTTAKGKLFADGMAVSLFI